jgi:hypothetical protein
VIAGILAVHAADDPCESGQGLGRSGLAQDCATFVLRQTTRRPLCPFCEFLVSDLDRPFCHPLYMACRSFTRIHPLMIMVSSVSVGLGKGERRSVKGFNE